MNAKSEGGRVQSENAQILLFMCALLGLLAIEIQSSPWVTIARYYVKNKTIN